ncbi:RNA polymerase sigma factor [Streptomyces sp. HK10]|uniref:RNA polymerase sigma factor n=1 Tax=Streptomyces sp. HK10 TaxID=3373255 RepID=UPI00374A88AC
MSGQRNADLLSGCIQGEQEAWEELVERFGRLVWSVVHKYRLSPADAEDVRQLTWFRLVQNVHQIRDPERLGDWLATVARRESIKISTRGKRLVLVGDSDVLDVFTGHGESAEQITLRAHRNAEVMNAIEGMSEQCRNILLMTLCDPPASYEHVSTALSMSIGSVGPIRTRCLRRLRRALAEADAGEEPRTVDCTGCPAGKSAPRGRQSVTGDRTPTGVSGRVGG